MKKKIGLLLLILFLLIGSYNVGAASTVPASGVAYENGSTTTTVKDSLDDLISKTKVGTATAAQILSGKTALVQGSTVTGTMTDQGAKTASLNAGGSYTIPAGYHNGSGKVTANSLASQTSATATASQILSGQTAYVNGSKITGTMTNQGAKTSTLNAGGSYTIPAGYHNGSGKITANSLASQTSATATAAQILSGQTAYVNGSKITGTMTNRGAVTSTLNAGGSYTIPAGYHNGSGKITANSLSSQTSATATASDIAKGKTAYVNGSKITGTNDGGYKVKDFNGTATVSYINDFTGSWVTMGYEKASGCTGSGDNATCDWTAESAVFSIDLGFTPTSVVAISATLYAKAYDTAMPFRMTNGYAKESTTASYRYLYELTATNYKYGSSTESDGFLSYSSTSDTASNYSIRTSVTGSKLTFTVAAARWSFTNGTSNNIFQTSATSFGLRGSITYK